MKPLLVALWTFTATIGVVVILTGIVTVLDPVGTKMADDGDPFGPPRSRIWSLFGTLCGVALVAWPVPLVLRSGRPQKRSTTSESGTFGPHPMRGETRLRSSCDTNLQLGHHRSVG